MKHKNRGFTLVEFLKLVFASMVITGYIANIVKIFNIELTLAEYTIVEISRCVGVIFPPLGVFMGFLNF